MKSFKQFRHRYAVILTKSRSLAMCIALLVCWGPSNAGSWKNESGDNSKQPLCLEIAGQLRQHRWKDAIGYWQVLMSYRGFSDPPWAELVPAEHALLLQKINRYENLGAREFFRDVPRLEQTVDTDQFFKVVIEPQIKAGARLQLWRTRLAATYNEGQQTAPAGEQAVIQWRTVIRSGVYGRRSSTRRLELERGWQGAVFLVTPDLAGPDPNVDPGTARALASTSVLMFRGAPFLFDTNGNVFAFTQHSGLQTYCSFRFIEGARK